MTMLHKRSIRLLHSLVHLSGLIWMIGSFLLLPAFAADYTKEDLQGKSFAGRDLTDSSFVKTNLRGSDFSHVVAVGTNFFGANFMKANLQNANLKGATLDMANLSGADLRGALLENSLMWLTRVDDALIEGADFTDAMLRQDTFHQLCQTASGVNPTTKRATRETLGCP
jgi:uncharacterized protein YjbI with pentapeptide repeats